MDVDTRMVLAMKTKESNHVESAICTCRIIYLLLPADFPLMALYVVPKLRTDASDFLETSRKNALDIFDPGNLGYCGDHFFHLCREVCDPICHKRVHFKLIFMLFFHVGPSLN